MCIIHALELDQGGEWVVGGCMLESVFFSRGMSSTNLDGVTWLLLLLTPSYYLLLIIIRSTEYQPCKGTDRSRDFLQQTRIAPNDSDYYWPLHQSNPWQRRAKIAAWTPPSKGGKAGSTLAGGVRTTRREMEVFCTVTSTIFRPQYGV